MTEVVEPELGRLLVAGVGAIGSAILYILGGTQIKADIALLDRDTVEASNLNRSPLFTVRDAANRTSKVAAGKQWLENHGLTAQIFQGEWNEHLSKIQQDSFDVWVSLTNENGVWGQLPYQLPPVVIHGTTTSGWGLALGRHIPRVEDCTLCRMPRPEAVFRPPCAEGEIVATPERLPVRASLPFLSSAAAALVVAELCKMPYLHRMVTPNSVSADLLYGLQALISIQRGPDLKCPGCRISQSKTWHQYGGRSRYAPLSQNIAG